MNHHRICFAKDSGLPSGGKGAPAEPVAAPAGVAAGSSAIDSCPFCIPVKVTSPGGEQVIAIRSEYIPNWLDENRDKPLPFTPESWEPVERGF